MAYRAQSESQALGCVVVEATPEPVVAFDDAGTVLVCNRERSACWGAMPAKWSAAASRCWFRGSSTLLPETEVRLALTDRCRSSLGAAAASRFAVATAHGSARESGSGPAI